MENGELIGNGTYTINKIEDVKDYYISQTNYEGPFGIKDVLCATGEGNERFYVMALTDIDGQQNGTKYCWYDAAYDNKMSDYATATSGDFGAGKQNTLNMIEKWNNKEYGAQDDNGTYKDVWGQIQEQVNAGWFVPSKGEWSAFGEELGITKKNYASKNLRAFYWSSSQSSTNGVWSAYFNNGYVGNRVVDNNTYVRLGTTF